MTAAIAFLAGSNLVLQNQQICGYSVDARHSVDAQQNKTLSVSMEEASEFHACHPLYSSVMPLVNSKPYRVVDGSEQVIGKGLVAASCKSAGWNYIFVYPKFDQRWKEWYDGAYKAVLSEGNAPLCGYDWNEPLHSMFVKSKCDLVVDVGGNIGLSVAPAASKGFRILVFEPVPLNIEILHANIWLNGWDVNQVGLVGAGASSSTRNDTIFAPVGREDNTAITAEIATANLGGLKTVQIPIKLVSLDDYFDGAHHLLFESISLIKIDTQGHELPVLQGMHKILSSGRREFALSVEIDSKLQKAAGHDPKDIEKYMDSLGWKPFCATATGLTPATTTGLTPGSSCYDVVFVHSSSKHI